MNVRGYFLSVRKNANHKTPVGSHTNRDNQMR